MNIFVINGHKYYPYAEGKLNRTLFDSIVNMVSSENKVMSTIIENGYEIDDEIEKFKWADVIIFQTPMNWFSIPWIFKKYIDEIYQYGIFYAGSKDYGNGGIMKNKRYMYSITCNSPESEFNNADSFFNGRSAEDMVIALHKLQQYSGMQPIKSYFCYDVVHNPDIPAYLKGLEHHINRYIFNDQ